ncbi:MAG: hypothetical protein HY721_20010 [Planctomycetes bacterium]|nr:hypothetical protein [Planctomycetota bacterium]
MPRKIRSRDQDGARHVFPALLRQSFYENLAVLVDEEMKDAMKDPDFRESVRRAAREIARGMQKMIAKWDRAEG